jgi:hypothetical protein
MQLPNRYSLWYLVGQEQGQLTLAKQNLEYCAEMGMIRHINAVFFLQTPAMLKAVLYFLNLTNLSQINCLRLASTLHSLLA